MKVVINTQYGGFSLSEKAYERLIELGVPARKYVEQERDPETHLYKPQPLNDGEVIFDRELSPDGDGSSAIYHKYKDTEAGSVLGRYWEAWIDENRSHPLLIQVVEELGKEANGRHATLKIVEVPDGVEYELDEYDGIESIHEKHRSWS